MEVKDQVQFTHITKVFVKDLHECLDQLQDNQLVFVLVHNRYKIQWSVSFINDFVVFVLDKIAGFGFSSDD